MRPSRFIVPLCAAFLFGCPPGDTPPPDPTPQPTPSPSPAPIGDVGNAAAKGPFTPVGDPELASLTHATSAFAADLYGHLAKTQQGNFAASPISIALALSMAYAGAQGETAAQMQSTLHFTMGGDEVHRAFGTLLRNWTPGKDAQYELTVANRLFGYQGVSFEESFLGVTADHYQAPLEKLDFRNKTEESRKHINSWVEDKTEKKIADLLPEGALQPDAVLVLTNAIYFNGTWSEKFDQKATVAKPFFAASGKVSAPTMHMEDMFQYGEADGNKLLTMSYRGGSMAMTIVLPDAKDGIAATEQAVAAGKLASWTEGMSRAKVKVALPKFEISGASISLKSTLVDMGMPLAFDEAQANFRGMAAGGEPNLFIGEVFHKAFVDLHEDGTEAAAATGAVMYPTSAVLPSEPRTFVADHPFLFFLRDLSNGAILFMGRVSDPTKKKS